VRGLVLLVPCLSKESENEVTSLDVHSDFPNTISSLIYNHSPVYSKNREHIRMGFEFCVP